MLLVAFDILGLPAVSDVLRQFLLWLPNLIVALVILFIAALAADALAKFVRGATTEARFANPDTLATVARVAVWAFAVVIAVNQLGIAETLINTLFVGTWQCSRWPAGSRSALAVATWQLRRSTAGGSAGRTRSRSSIAHRAAKGQRVHQRRERWTPRRGRRGG